MTRHNEPRPVETSPETLIDSRYRLEALIGRGGMGAVYRAVDTRLDRTVAVKLLDESPGTDESRFDVEVRALAHLVHPNLVRLLDAGEAEGRLFLVMDLVDGPSLAAKIARGPLPSSEVARIGAGIAGAIAYVHRHGVIHRDVKPGNILLDQQGEPFLADFGIARLLDTSGVTATGFTLGTLAYLAPEQVQGSAIGPPADIYALGLVLAECLTGRRVFNGTPSELAAARLHQEPTIPEVLGLRWHALLTAMTARRPADRIEPAEAALELDQLLLEPNPVDELNTELLDHESTAVMPSSPVVTQTVPLDPATVVAPVAPTRIQRQRPAPTMRNRIAPKRLAMSVAALLLGFLVLGLWLGGVFSGPTPSGRPSLTLAASDAHRKTATTTTTTSTSTTTTTPTTTTVPTTTASSATALLSELQSGVADGEIAPPAGQQLSNQLQPLLFSANPGNSGQAVQQFDQLVQTFDQAVAGGQITGSSVTTLTSTLDELATTLGTTVPTSTSTPPGPPGTPFAPGPGKGHGHGHA